ncbi:MAG: glutamine synthetase family protein [Myxococcota bacterium]
MSDNADHNYIIHHVRELGVKLIRLWFADVAGRLKEVAITSEQLETVLEEGLGIDGGVMGGPTQDESELILLPDASTFALLPPVDGVSEVGRMFCDVRLPSGEPAPDDTRAVLKAALARAGARGYTFYAGCEIEHFYFRDGSSPLVPMDRGRRYDARDAVELVPLKRETLLALEQLGVAVDSFHHEDAPGQYKVGLQYNDALSMADGLVTYRQVARQVAQRFGVIASFMPKPLTEHEGSGLHFSLSLTRGEENVFYGASDPHGLSDLARGFLAGLLAHAPAITLVTNPTVNSYKRLAPGFSAPVACTWAPSGRGDLVRIPALQAGHGPRSTRLEYRVADPSCNPYLALTALLEAGLDGADLELAPPAPRDAELAPERAGASLPRSLAEAISRSRESELLTRALGDALHDELLTAAQQQWDDYHTHVSAWEIANYLEG